MVYVVRIHNIYSEEKNLSGKSKPRYADKVLFQCVYYVYTIYNIFISYFLFEYSFRLKPYIFQIGEVEWKKL